MRSLPGQGGLLRPSGVGACSALPLAPPLAHPRGRGCGGLGLVWWLGVGVVAWGAVWAGAHFRRGPTPCGGAGGHPQWAPGQILHGRGPARAGRSRHQGASPLSPPPFPLSPLPSPLSPLSPPCAPPSCSPLCYTIPQAARIRWGCQGHAERPLEMRRSLWSLWTPAVVCPCVRLCVGADSEGPADESLGSEGPC